MSYDYTLEIETQMSRESFVEAFFRDIHYPPLEAIPNGNNVWFARTDFFIFWVKDYRLPDDDNDTYSSVFGDYNPTVKITFSAFRMGMTIHGKEMYGEDVIIQLTVNWLKQTEDDMMLFALDVPVLCRKDKQITRLGKPDYWTDITLAMFDFPHNIRHEYFDSV
jgi:hypothetical protein